MAGTAALVRPFDIVLRYVAGEQGYYDLNLFAHKVKLGAEHIVHSPRLVNHITPSPHKDALKGCINWEGAKNT